MSNLYTSVMYNIYKCIILYINLLISLSRPDSELCSRVSLQLEVSCELNIEMKMTYVCIAISMTVISFT